MGETVTLTGMILTSSPMKEYDKRIEILTKERGRISAFAQGARKVNSALSACTIPFTFGNFQLYEGRTAYNLKSAAPSDFFGDIANDYDALCYASYFAEMMQYISRENVEAGGELALMYVTMKALMSGKVPRELIRIIFEFRLMYLQGEGIELFSCLECGREDSADVYISRGGIICKECASKAEWRNREEPFILSPDAKYTLQYIITSKYEKLYTFNVSGQVMDELKKFMMRYKARYMPHHFKTADFMV